MKSTHLVFTDSQAFVALCAGLGLSAVGAGAVSLLGLPFNAGVTALSFVVVGPLFFDFVRRILFSAAPVKFNATAILFGLALLSSLAGGPAWLPGVSQAFSFAAALALLAQVQWRPELGLLRWKGRILGLGAATGLAVTLLSFAGLPGWATALLLLPLPAAAVVTLKLEDVHDPIGTIRQWLNRAAAAMVAVLVFMLLFVPLAKLAEQAGTAVAWAAGGAALLTILLLQPIQDGMRKRIDRIFFPDREALVNLLNHAIPEIATTIRPEELEQLATCTIPTRIGAECGKLLVMDEDGQYMRPLRGGEPMLGHESGLRRRLEEHVTLNLVRPASAAQVDMPVGTLLIPLLVGGRLVGAYVIGPRISGTPFTCWELGPLQSLGYAVAVALENVRSYARIAELNQRAVAEVEERNRLAREIHDTLAQGITGIGLQLEVVQATMATKPARAERALNRAFDLVKSNLDQARRSVVELRAPLLGGESLAGALTRLVRQVAADAGAEGHFANEGGLPTVAPRTQTAIYRIAQEALHNALKYAAADHLTVILRADAETLQLVVADDGAGFDPAAVGTGSRQGGFGLVGMQERAQLLGGHLTIESSPGRGCQVKAIFPLHHAEEELL